jgi:hypothetical protein
VDTNTLPLFNIDIEVGPQKVLIDYGTQTILIENSSFLEVASSILYWTAASVQIDRCVGKVGRCTASCREIVSSPMMWHPVSSETALGGGRWHCWFIDNDMPTPWRSPMTKTPTSLRILAGAIALGTISVHAGQASAASLAVQLACATDYYAYCSKHDPDGPATRACMNANGARLSNRCVNALVSAGEVSRAEVDRRAAQSNTASRGK